MTQAELQEKFPDIKDPYLMNNGWDSILLNLYSYIDFQQQSLALLTAHKRFDPPKDVNGNLIPNFKCQVLQIKEKFGFLRIYIDITESELDWSIYSKEDYENYLAKYKCQIRGYTDAVEEMSGQLCEECGDKGDRKDMDGWFKTLCKNHENYRSTNSP